MGNVESRPAQQVLDGTLADFDSSIVRKRVDEMWKLNVRFGEERSPFNVHLDQVADRYVLTKGFQLIRDELMLGFNRYSADPITSQACAADLSLPSVLTTCGYTNCGDRICQNAVKAYAQTVASRFASVTEYGEAKPEVFCPTGGGTDSGPTLAHVTVAHQIDKPIRNQIYNGNPHSYVLVNIDINTHCGHYDSGDKITFGKAQESKFRDARAACGAIVGTLTGYNPNNGVHVRLRADLGEENFEFLSNNKILADDGSDVTFLVAAAIVSVQGMRNTLRALAENELDERGLGHVTACVNVNNAGPDECLVYCARGTVFDGKIKEQGLGTDATKYTARTYVGADGKKKVKLLYGNVSVEVRRGGGEE
ncbi:hypothetical protein GUITHDRAFT_83219 [Guillardia theta CCMP2712]|uniref:Uncharacterized protein n=1 Tax=Guillardia theta (strain CCMP2712) TaxID=905079 RepID=L1I5F7_GUITC|nr:hypothetical protein GUITHDRAFT_83219 [Guillardia theta CCMP2712]EKX31297.1 hypothetical protein GUITHDRAFT_83219 [Guillardia theta CCMP2712]|eukprot:XP_005818277.1 hypothetical protein GUITHDRAFT_83219 [Guillardia theta CCMP2712]